MNRQVVEALEAARDYVQLIADSTGCEDDGEQRLIRQLNAAIQEERKYFPVLRISREEVEKAASYQDENDEMVTPHLDDEDIHHIISRTADAILETGFWNTLELMACLYLGTKGGSE